MAELSGARTVVLVLRSPRREDVEAWRRTREEKVVRERWVPRMSIRGTAGWRLGSSWSWLLSGGGMTGRMPGERCCWGGREAAATVERKRKDDSGFMM